MTNLPKDGFEGIDYSFIDDAGVPTEFKDKFSQLRQEMDDLLALQKQKVSETQNHIATLMSWATVAANALTIIESLIPLLPLSTPTKEVTKDDKDCWLAKLGATSCDLDNLTQMLKKLLKRPWTFNPRGRNLTITWPTSI